MGKGISGHELPNNGKSNEWYTPPYITDALGNFDLDPCAGIVRKRDIAATNYTCLDDGLSKLWTGRVWLNPPYGDNTKLWLARMASHRNGIVLIFARTETRMFHQHVWPVASGIFFFEGRIKFLSPDGCTSGGSAGAPSCLISYDPLGENRNFTSLQNCGLRGRVISLASPSQP